MKIIEHQPPSPREGDREAVVGVSKAGSSNTIECNCEDVSLRDVLYFVPTGPAPLRVLVIETSRLLPALRKKLPNARITAVTEYDVVPEARELAGLDVSWSVLDYRVTPLPFAEGSFDLIVAEPVLS